jgi:O-antigen ligase
MFSRLAFLFLLYYVAIGLTQPQNRFLFLHPFKIAQVAFILGGFFHILSVSSEDKPLIRMGPATIFSIILILAGLLSQYFGPLMTNTAWNGYIDQLTKSAVAVILLEATATNIYRVWAVQWTILVCTLWWVKAGLRLGSAGVTYAGDRIMGPAVSMVENPNGFAYFTCVTMCIYLYFFQQTKQKYLKLGFLALTLIGIWIVLNTGSRTGMVLLVALSFFLLPKYGGQHKVALVIIIAATPLILGSIGAMNIERFKTIPDSIRSFLSGEELSLDQAALEGADEHSAVERKLKNRDTWALIKEYPVFGVGMNPNESLFAEDYPFAQGQVHNEILMAGRQMGIPGMILYLTMLGIIIQRGWKVQQYAKGWWPGLSDLGWTLKLQGLTILVGGMFAPLPWNTYTLVLMGSASALWLNLQEGRIYAEGVEGEG